MLRPVCHTRLFEVYCVGVDPRLCRAACEWIRRVGVDEIYERVNPEAARIRQALNARIPVLIVNTRAEYSVLDEAGLEFEIEDLPQVVSEMEERGVDGMVYAGIGLVLVHPGEEERRVAAKAVEEAIHAALLSNTLFIHTATGRYLRDMDEWLVEEEAVHRLLYEHGLLTRDEYEATRRAYEEVYRETTGREPPRDYQRLAEKLVRAIRGMEA